MLICSPSPNFSAPYLHFSHQYFKTTTKSFSQIFSDYIQIHRYIDNRNKNLLTTINIPKLKFATSSLARSDIITKQIRRWRRRKKRKPLKHYSNRITDGQKWETTFPEARLNFPSFSSLIFTRNYIVVLCNESAHYRFQVAHRKMENGREQNETMRVHAACGGNRAQ